MIDFLKSPDEIEQQLNRLIEHAKLANESVERVGKAEDIERLLAEAERERADATELLENARAEREKIIALAHESQQQSLDQSREYAKRIIAEADSKKGEAMAMFRDAEELKNTAVQEARKTEQLAKQLDNLRISLEQRKNNIEKKEAVLAQLQGLE